MFKIEKFNKKQHNRDLFCCKNPSFNDYLKKIANQDFNSNRAIVYVAVKSEDQTPKKIYGYFTINAYSIAARENSNPFLPSAVYGYLLPY